MQLNTSYATQNKVCNYDIDKSKNLMKSMKGFQVFSPDGFHQTIYGKLFVGNPELCLLFDAKDMHSTTLLNLLENIQNSQTNTAILLTNDPNFMNNTDFLTHESPQKLIVMRNTNDIALIIGQPQYFKITVNIDSDKFSMKNIDKFVSNISNLSIDDRYFEMPQSWSELESIDTTTQNFKLHFGLYINHCTNGNQAVAAFKARSQEYLYPYGVHAEIQEMKISDGFYSKNLRLRHEVQRKIESSIQEFIYLKADYLFIPQNLMIKSDNLLGIAYSTDQMIDIVQALQKL